MADKAGTGRRPDQVENPPQPGAKNPEVATGGATEVRPGPGAARPLAGPEGAQPVAGPTPVDLPSRVEAIRGWLAALDRRVSIRTQVGIVLLALAIGFGAAALYMAIDTRENSASEARVESLRQALQALNVRTARTARQVRELQASAGSAASGAGAGLEGLQAQVTQLNAQVEALQAASSGTTEGGAAGTTKGGSAGATTTPGGDSGGKSGATQGTATR